MRVLTLTMLATLITGCSSIQNDKLNSDEIYPYMKKQPTLSTPRDGLIFANLNCFSDFDNNGSYKETISYSYQGFLSEGVYAENYYVWDQNRKTKTADDSESRTLIDYDAEGVVLEYFFEEDLNGEYVASMSLSKKTFINNKKVNGKPVNVFKTIEYSKNYYPKNKKPMKVFEDQDEICYITASW